MFGRFRTVVATATIAARLGKAEITMKAAATVLGAGLFCFAIAGNAQANLLVNGSFENATGFVGDGNGVDEVAVGSTAITGWTVFSDDISWAGANTFGLSASDGTYFLDLTGYHNSNPTGGIEQSLATQIGATYLITFDLGSSPQYVVPAGLLLTAANTSQSFVSTSTVNNFWQSESLSFTATDTNTLISFVGNLGSSYIGLDNVVVTETSVAPTPLPAALPLFATGLGAMGLVGWRRKRKNTAAIAA